MSKQKQARIRVLALGLGEYDKVEQQLGDEFELRNERFADVDLQKENERRTTDVVVIGRKDTPSLEKKVVENPIKYRSHVSIGCVTDKVVSVADTPFDGTVTRPTHESVVRDIKHLNRLTEVKRILNALYYVSRALATMRLSGSTVDSDIRYNQLRECRREISDELNQLGAEICRKDACALFSAVDVPDGKDDRYVASLG